MKKIIDGLAYFLSFIFNYRCFRWRQYCLSKIQSFSLSRRFAKAGENLFIEHPAFIGNEQCISIGRNFFSRGNLRLIPVDTFMGKPYSPQIIIGDDVRIESDCNIICSNQIHIGNNVLIASKVFITDHSHGEVTSEAIKRPPFQRNIVSKGPVIIEANVWVGENVAIMPNVTIGENAIIGAHSVVTKSVPKNAVVMGVPAKVVRVLGA